MSPDRRQQPGATRGERVVFAVALAIIATVVGVLVVSGITGGSEPPTFDTSDRRVEEVDGRFQLAVTVKNVGDQAAADVRVVASGRGDTSIDQTLRFLAAGEEEDVRFLFDEDPTGSVSVTVDGYREP